MILNWNPKLILPFQLTNHCPTNKLERMFIQRADTVLKTGFIVLSMCWAFEVFATPKVGDFARYTMSRISPGLQTDYSIIQELTDYDSVNRSFLVHREVSYPGGSTEVSNDWASEDSLISDAKIDYLLGNCANSGGTLENLIVPCGTFTTCKMPFENEQEKGSIWIAKVPFGAVKMELNTKSDGLSTISILNSYH